MVSGQLFDDSFKRAVRKAGARARIETLQSGIPVFYRDSRRNLDIVEYPSGRKFKIRFLNNPPREQNYEVIRELDKIAA